MTLRLLLSATLAAAAPLAARAQGGATDIRPGSPEVDGSRVVARTDTFAMMATRDGRERSAGYLELRTARATAAGVPAVLRVERMTSHVGDEFAVDSFALAAATLAPLSFGDRDGEQGGSLTFEGLAVRGERTAEGKTTPIAARLASPVFLGNAMDVVLSALPLAEGRVFRWQSLREQDAGVEPVEVRVDGSERVRTVTGGTCQAWRVEARSGDETSVYWVEKGTGELLQYRGGELRFLILRHRACPGGDEATRAAVREGDETGRREAA